MTGIVSDPLSEIVLDPFVADRFEPLALFADRCDSLWREVRELAARGDDIEAIVGRCRKIALLTQAAALTAEGLQ